VISGGTSCTKKNRHVVAEYDQKWCYDKTLFALPGHKRHLDKDKERAGEEVLSKEDTKPVKPGPLHKMTDSTSESTSSFQD
jgi:hypothetical protein